jgi:hypothetical protein
MHTIGVFSVIYGLDGMMYELNIQKEQQSEKETVVDFKGENIL